MLGAVGALIFGCGLNPRPEDPGVAASDGGHQYGQGGASMGGTTASTGAATGSGGTTATGGMTGAGGFFGTGGVPITGVDAAVDGGFGGAGGTGGTGAGGASADGGPADAAGQ